MQVGTGADIAAARAPVLVRRGDLTIALLSVNSIRPMGYWADERRPGCAPLRGHTLYEQIEHDQPGTPARIHTWPYAEDLGALLASIRDVQARADIVVLSHHAGIHFVLAVIPDYQREVARRAIDAGADIVLGHHAHILTGAKIYRGKPILYSLAIFAIDLRMDPAQAASSGFREIQKLNPDWIPDFDSLYNFPPDSAMSVIAEADLTRGNVDLWLRLAVGQQARDFRGREPPAQRNEDPAKPHHRLLHDDLPDRVARDSDHRIQRLFPTDAGTAAAKDWHDRLKTHEDAMLHRLSDAERAELCRLLGLIWMP